MIYENIKKYFKKPKKSGKILDCLFNFFLSKIKILALNLGDIFYDKNIWRINALKVFRKKLLDFDLGLTLNRLVIFYEKIFLPN